MNENSLVVDQLLSTPLHIVRSPLFIAQIVENYLDYEHTASISNPLCSTCPSVFHFSDA